MSIYILQSPTTEKMLAILNVDGIKDAIVVDSNASLEVLEQITNGRHTVIVPEDAPMALKIIMNYCDVFRNADHGKTPLIILNDNEHYKPLIGGFLNKYRQVRPDVPRDEADSHYLVFRRKLEDFFQLTTSADLSSTISNLQSLLESKPKMEMLPFKANIEELNKKCDGIKILNNPAFKQMVKKQNSVLIVGAREGAAWDANNRNKSYYDCGKALVELGYGCLLSGGPDGMKSNNGPQLHSAEGVENAGGRIAVCYTETKFNKNCDINALAALGNVDCITFAEDEASRQNSLIENADLVIALPGALGTLAEAISALMKDKPVILWNVKIEERECNYFDSFINLLQHYGFSNVYHVDVKPNLDYNDLVAKFREVISQARKLAPSQGHHEVSKMGVFSSSLTITTEQSQIVASETNSI